jgi:phospholipid/cholesterol/gamma-HCH transport system substrate-binding protein
LYKRAQTIVRQAEETMGNVKQASEDAKRAIGSFQSKEGPVQSLSAELRLTLSHAREALADLADDTEAIKRNFLFRGFFNRRGYFDLDEISPAAYREGVFQAKGQMPLRIWLDARVLFAREAAGTETLTKEGRTRIDSAMATFLEYGRGNVLMVEGYARGASKDEQFVLSQSRAGMVRDHVIARFGLKAQNVGVMPLGADAPGSPSGSTWDGVGLALFVQRESFGNGSAR